MEARQVVERGPARHAKVVPAFFVNVLHRPVDSWVGQVSPVELVRWERKGDLPETARRDLRQRIVQRSRDRAEQLWRLPTGVRLADGWRDSLAPRDRRLVEALNLTDDKPLQEWTLREVKDGLRVPLERTLEILANLEAVYWNPSVSTSTRVEKLLDGQLPNVRLTPELKDLAMTALGLPWLSQVGRHDLRFAHSAPDGLPQWINTLMGKETVPGNFRGLLEQLLAAHELTAEAEARDIVLAAASRCVPPSGGVAATQRWSSILLRRYISRVGAGRTLAQVGDEYGVTRERVRQICEAFEGVFAGTSIVAPALERVLQAAARVAPAESADLDEQLRRYIGEDAGIESLVSWGKAIGIARSPVECERVRTRVRGHVVEVTMVQRPDSPSWVQAMIRHVSRDSSMFGCTNVLRIAGRLAFQEGVAPGQEAIEAGLEAAAGFRWLDRQSGWFALGDSSTCAAAARLRKIMAVARESIGTDEIAGALASDDMWLYREGTTLGLATPPVHVLRELFAGWAWLKVVQRGRFIAGPSFDPTGVLSDAERAIVETIERRDGIACRFELKEVVMARLGLTDVLVTAVLGSSPIVDRVEFGLYRLRGRRVGNDALSAARRRLQERALRGKALPSELAPNEFLARVTEASLRNEQYGVPLEHVARLAGMTHEVIDQDGRRIGQARIGRAGRLAGLNRLFPDARPGDCFAVEALDSGLKVRLCRSDTLATDCDRAGSRLDFDAADGHVHGSADPQAVGRNGIG